MCRRDESCERIGRAKIMKAGSNSCKPIIFNQKPAMKILQFVQLSPRQREDAIKKMVAISIELDVPVAGVRGEAEIRNALGGDIVPDADFIFDEVNGDVVDVIYRENI